MPQSEAPKSSNEDALSVEATDTTLKRVVEPKLPTVSASQYELYHNKCKRAWWFRYVVGLPDRQTFNQKLGTATHAIVEASMTGVPVDADTQGYVATDETPVELAKQALASLPDRTYQSHYTNEQFFSMPTYPGGPNWIGYIDLIVRPGIGLPALIIPPDNYVPIVDFKTTSNFRYMKTESELRVNPQMVSYGYWAVEHGFPSLNLDGAWLAHIYLNTKLKPVTRANIRHVRVDVPRHDLYAEWGKMLVGVQEMEETRTVACGDDVDPTGFKTGHCNAFGGCPYKSQCGLDAHAILFGRKARQEIISVSNPLLDRINAAKAAQAAQAAQATQPAAAPAAPPPPVQAPSAPVTVSSLLKTIADATGGKRPQLGGEVAAQWAQENNWPPPNGGYAGQGLDLNVMTIADLESFAKSLTLPPVVTITRVEVANENPDRFVQAVAAQATGKLGFEGVVPPDAPPRTQEVITTPGTVVTTAQPAVSANPTVAPAVQSNVPMPTSEAPKRRGRPPGAKNRPKTETAAPSSNEHVPGRDTPNEIDEGLALYIDCLPTKGGSYVPAEEWLQPIAQAVAEANGVAHWGLIQYISRAALANGVETVVSSGEPVPNLFIDSRLQGAEVLIEVLSPLATKVVRGVR